MAEKPISVSIRASRVYVKAIKALAGTKGTTIADLTKKAIDECLGAELAPYLTFFTSAGNDERQSATNKDSSGPGAA